MDHGADAVFRPSEIGNRLDDLHHAGPGGGVEAQGAIRMAGGVVTLVVTPVHDGQLGRRKPLPFKGAGLGSRLARPQISSVWRIRLARFAGAARSSKIVPAIMLKPRA